MDGLATGCMKHRDGYGTAALMWVLQTWTAIGGLVRLKGWYRPKALAC